MFGLFDLFVCLFCFVCLFVCLFVCSSYLERKVLMRMLNKSRAELVDDSKGFWKIKASLTIFFTHMIFCVSQWEHVHTRLYNANVFQVIIKSWSIIPNASNDC